MENLQIFRVSFNFDDLSRVNQKVSIRVLTGLNSNFLDPPFDDFFFLAFKWDSVKIIAFEENQLFFEATSELSDLETEKNLLVSTQEDFQGISVSLKIQAVGKGKSRVSEQVSQCLKEIEKLTESLSQFSLSNNTEFDLTSSGLSLFFLPNLQETCSKEPELIESLLTGLNEKLKVLQVLDFLLKITEQQSQNHLLSRLDVEKNVEKQSKDLQELQKSQEKLLNDSQDSLKAIRLLLNSQMVLTRHLESKIIELLSQVKFQEAKIETQSSQMKNFEIQEEKIKTLQKNLESSDRDREKLRENFENFKQSQSILDETRLKELESLFKENQNLRGTLKNLQRENFLLSEYIAKQESDLSLKNSLIKSMKSDLDSFKNLESKAGQMESLAKANQEIIVKTFEQLSVNTSKFSEVVSILNSEKLKMLRTSADLQLFISKLEQQNKNLTDKSKSEAILCQEHKASLAVLIQSELVNKDCKNITKTLAGLYSDVSKAKNKFLTDFDLLLKTFFQTSKGLLLVNRCISKIREINQEKDMEIIVFQEILTQIQKSMPYVAVKEDEIDQALANYLNSLPYQLQVPFLREDSGIYLFGTKRVVIKLDNGQLSIRVGGGAILVDEFIQMYSENEIQKTQERGKRKNSPSRPAAIGKVLSFAVGDKPKNDVSPQKAAKIILEMTGKNRILTTKRNDSRGKAEFLSPLKRGK